MENHESRAAVFGKVVELPERYPPPEVFPSCGHPRVLFTKGSLAAIKKNINAAENRPAYLEYLRCSEKKITGVLPAPESGHNMSYPVLAAIEAKAFRYALDGEVSYAREALDAILDFIATLNIPAGTLSDSCRAFGYVMYIAGCVYDWCYDAICPEERELLVAGCENLMAAKLEVGMPPSGQGAFVGHGTEAQLLRDWLTLGIAAYDEHPSIYSFVAGRIFSEYREVSDHFLRSGSHWQGSAYGPYRMHFLVYAQELISRMTEGGCELFGSGLHDAAVTFLHYIRPDGQALRVGDDFNEYGSRYQLDCYHKLAFFAGNHYNDPILKGFARSGLDGFTSFGLSNNSLSPVMFLALNKPELACAELAELPLWVYNGSPLGSIIARSSWTAPDAAMVYMKLGEVYTANHEHKDAGSFQICYKGVLASDSGSYDSYFTPQDICYNKQTVSSNSLLIFNKAMGDNKKWKYSGGQTIEGGAGEEHRTLAELLAAPVSHQARITGHDCGEGCYYLAGDLTGAYDAETVERVTRGMMAIMTGDAAHPLIFAACDHIVSRDASFEKTWLLHTQSMPELSDGFAVVTDRRNGGRLVVRSCCTATDIRLVKGNPANGVDYPLCRSFGEDSINETGWGRIEITPSERSESSRLLTVMYTCNAASPEPPVKAADIESDTLIGAELFGHALLFRKSTASESGRVSFSLKEDGICHVAGLAAGSWQIDGSTETVVCGGGLLSFASKAGAAALTKIK